MEDIYWREGRPEWPATPVEYDFYKDIWPVLKSAALISWTNNAALQGHGEWSTILRVITILTKAGPSSNGHFSSEKVVAILRSNNTEKKNTLKTRIFEKLRKPDNEDPSQADTRYMPRLSGDKGKSHAILFKRDLTPCYCSDDMPVPGTFPPGLQPDIERFAALTKLQYERFREWKDDTEFRLPIGPEPSYQKLEDFQKKYQPEYLTRAILGTTIGDSLHPGIEMHWSAKLPSTMGLAAASSITYSHDSFDSMT